MPERTITKWATFAFLAGSAAGGFGMQAMSRAKEGGDSDSIASLRAPTATFHRSLRARPPLPTAPGKAADRSDPSSRGAADSEPTAEELALLEQVPFADPAPAEEDHAVEDEDVDGSQDSGGASLSDSLARLEAEYQLMRLRTERLERELALRDAAGARSRENAEPAASSTSSKLAASQPSSSDASRAPSTGLAPTSAGAAGTSPAAAAPNVHVVVNVQPAPAASATNDESQDDEMNGFNQPGMVVVNYAPVLVPVPVRPQRAHNAPASSDRTLYQMSLDHQRAVRSPLSTQSRILGTPQSPWAPIDMSRHNNPWSGSRLP